MARRECARQTGFSSLWRQLAEKKTRYAITSTERVGRKSACRQARCGAKRIYCSSSLFVLQFSKLHTFENCCVATLSNVYPYPFYTALILRNIQHPFTASHNEWLLLSGVVIIISTRDEFSIRLSPNETRFPPTPEHARTLSLQQINKQPQSRTVSGVVAAPFQRQCQFDNRMLF